MAWTVARAGPMRPVFFETPANDAGEIPKISIAKVLAIDDSEVVNTRCIQFLMTQEGAKVEDSEEEKPAEEKGKSSRRRTANDSRRR